VIWKFALLGGIATASVQTAVAHEPLGGQLLLAPRTAPTTPPMRVTVRTDPAGAPATLFVRRPGGTRWSNGLVVLWMTAAGAGLLWLTIAHSRSLVALGDRTDLRDTPIGRRLRALLARARVERHVELTCSDTISSPVALVGDEVCLPRRALLELPPNEQDGMLAHEVAHVVRRDPQWLVAARVIEVVLFMQPLNRLARRRMQEVAEFLCDDWAVSRMGKPVTLAKCLAAVAEWVKRAPNAPEWRPMSAMVEQGGSPLVQRVGRILSGGAAPRARTGHFAAAVSACALVALAGAAPRVAIARGSISQQQMSFVQALGVPASRAPGARVPAGGAVFTTGTARIVLDSVVALRQPAGARVAAGPRDIVIQHLVVDSSVIGADSAVNVVWTRRVPPVLEQR
jgi:beta-lactamase regulating signal transducer with metallopeptidase domain